MEAAYQDDADARSELCLALRLAGADKEELRRLIRKLAEDHPRHAGAALLMADLEAEGGRWEDVLQRTAGVDPKALDEGRARHYQHLLGLALLHTNRVKEALEAFQTGSRYGQGRCLLGPLTRLTQALADPPEVGDWGPDQPMSRQLVGVIRQADTALASDDTAAARNALERPALWNANELQSAARLATAYLATESTTPNERVLKRHALAFFCDAFSSENPRFMKMHLPGLSWAADRLAELDERARAWLEAGGPCD